MMQSNANIPRLRRIFLALAFMVAIPVLIWLSNSYLTSLNKRSQAVETSVAAQTVADQQQTNLQAMNSQLRSRFYQIFASMNNSVQDPSLSSSGGLIAADITASTINFDQALTNYQSNFELATSQNMSIVRAYLERNSTGSKILSDQQSALNAIVNKDWPHYKMYQDKVLIELQAIANQEQSGIKVSSQLMQLWYEQDYNTLFITNQAFTQLKRDWQQVADIAASSSIAVSSVGISETLPIIITLVCISFILLVFAIRWGIASFSMKAIATRSGRLSRHRMYNVTKKEQDGQATINLNTGVSSGNDTTSQEQQEISEQSGLRAGMQQQHLVPLQSEQHFPESGRQTDQEEEILRLKRELEITRQERDILKKTVSIFSHS
jgi:hypothetical protein